MRSFTLPAEEDTALSFREALAENGIREQETIHFDVKPTAAGSSFRSPAQRAADVVVLQPVAPAEKDAVQVVLYQDESGGLSWHLPDDLFEGSDNASRLRATTTPTFTIRTRTEAAKEVVHGPRNPARFRGPITKFGRKIFKVLVIPILSPLLARPIESIVKKIETKHQPNLIRPVTPENYRTKVTDPFSDWSMLKGNRALLIVHGIFSSTQGMLAQLPPGAMAMLNQAYGNRVIGLDQVTVSESPEDNARFFLETLKAAIPDGRVEFDILCHSRGGIVSRALAERGASILPGHNCDFRKVFFVATPNRGSALGNPEHIVDMLDVFTNFLTNFPDGPVMYTIEVILAVLKLLVHSAERSLPGLAAMGTSGYIRNVLNQPGDRKIQTEYGAAGSNYQPDPNVDNGFITGRFANYLVDKIFTEDEKAIANDLVVPQEGVFAANGNPLFPIQNPLVFGESDRVWHSGFFAHPNTITHINKHFGLETEEASLEPEVAAAPAYEKMIAYAGDTPEPPRRRGGFRSPTDISRSDVGPQPSPRPLSRSGDREPTELQRNPAIDFHEQVIEGETQELKVRLEDVAEGAAGAIRFLLAVDQDVIPLKVTLTAPGFDIAAPASPIMTVRRQRDPASEELTFNLTARNLGPEPVRREIVAQFWLANSVIGAVVHRTFVIPKNYTGSRPADGSKTAFEFVLPRERREDCDLVINVIGDDENAKPPFAVSIQSVIPGHEYPTRRMGKLSLGDPGQTIEQYVEDIYTAQFAQYPSRKLPDAEFDVAEQKWLDEFNDALDSLGKKLWTFLPEKFRTEYLKMAQEGWLPRSILIHSDETVFPWELVVPHGDIGGRFTVMEPLGTSHILGRWSPTFSGMKPQPQKLAVRTFSIINPTYTGNNALPWSQDEIEALQKLFPKASVVRPATRQNVSTNVLSSSTIQIVHYSGHGDYNPKNADLNSLLLEDGTLDALRITGSRLAAEGHPIIYLNACSVGAEGMVVGRMGGFAANFLASGCSGVIAPYWPINDARAMDFSLALYGKLNQGRAIGETLQELRREFPRDPTFRAFAYFGDPWARADFSSVT